MRQRGSRGLGRLLDLVPPGVELATMSELVEDDLVSLSDLRDLVEDPTTRDLLTDGPEIPRIRPVLVALASRANAATVVEMASRDPKVMTVSRVCPDPKA